MQQWLNRPRLHVGSSKVHSLGKTIVIFYLDPLPPPRGTYSPESSRLSLRPNLRPLGDPPPREPLKRKFGQQTYRCRWDGSHLPLVGLGGIPPEAPCSSCIMAWACAYWLLAPAFWGMGKIKTFIGKLQLLGVEAQLQADWGLWSRGQEQNQDQDRDGGGKKWKSIDNVKQKG